MIQLLGIPYDANSSFLKGPAYAPQRIRLMEREGSANTASEYGADIRENEAYTDGGDLVFETSNPEAAFHIIKNGALNCLKSGHKLLSLGGDHSVSYPLIAAFAEVYPDLQVLHLDAHGDLYDHFDNNPYSHASPFARIMEKDLVGSLTQVGIRTLTAHQRAQAQRFGVRVIEMKDLQMDFIHELKGPLYISLDLDVLDPAFAPGVSHHEPGGMSTRELLHILHRIGVPVVGADIVEYNPVRDVHNMTAMVAYKLMKELMAKMAEQ